MFLVKPDGSLEQSKLIAEHFGETLKFNYSLHSKKYSHCAYAKKL